MRDNLERGVTTRELATGRTFGRANHFCAETLRGFHVFVVQLKFNPQIHFRGDSNVRSIADDFTLPILKMKEDVFAKIFRLDESEILVFADRHNSTQSTTLNSESLLGFFFWRQRGQFRFWGREMEGLKTALNGNLVFPPSSV